MQESGDLLKMQTKASELSRGCPAFQESMQNNNKTVTVTSRHGGKGSGLGSSSQSERVILAADSLAQMSPSREKKSAKHKKLPILKRTWAR